MICGFINEDYNLEYKELTEEETEKICLEDNFFSINMDSEYIIFIKKNIYKEENMNAILPIVARAGKELFLKNKGGK